MNFVWPKERSIVVKTLIQENATCQEVLDAITAIAPLLPVRVIIMSMNMLGKPTTIPTECGILPTIIVGTR